MSYESSGSVRGSCGHRHRSIRMAYLCLCADRLGCRMQGGYSDRDVSRCDGEPFSQVELVELWELAEELR